MNEVSDFKNRLKEKNLKNTKHRNSILEVIAANGHPITAEEIYLKLKEQNVSISMSTVYRVLDVLIESELITKTNVTDDNKAWFEINTNEHKHHLLCVKCRKMLAIEGCPLEEYEKDLEKKLGFSIKGHKLEMYGLCDQCKNEKE